MQCRLDWWTSEAGCTQSQKFEVWFFQAVRESRCLWSVWCEQQRQNCSALCEAFWLIRHIESVRKNIKWKAQSPLKWRETPLENTFNKNESVCFVQTLKILRGTFNWLRSSLVLASHILPPSANETISEKIGDYHLVFYTAFAFVHMGGLQWTQNKSSSEAVADSDRGQGRQ